MSAPARAGWQLPLQLPEQRLDWFCRTLQGASESSGVHAVDVQLGSGQLLAEGLAPGTGQQTEQGMTQKLLKRFCRLIAKTDTGCDGRARLDTDLHLAPT